MSLPKWIRRNRRWVDRLAGLLVSLLLLTGGLATRMSGEPGYRNYFGGYVGGWIAIGLGVLGLTVTLLQWNGPRGRRRSKWRTRRGESSASPWDTFRKW